jgi:hypothetical protein
MARKTTPRSDLHQRPIMQHVATLAEGTQVV